MSEYQYVAFQAVDRPLDDRQLQFAERQSSRADVSRWSLTCEYNYSSFRGDVDGLLRRGYDVHLLYANYGDRQIKLRLPNGLPFAKKIWSQYIGENLVWKRDKKGRGGILSLAPYHESGELDEVWDFSSYLVAAVQVRERLMVGDLRALYVLWLCAADDSYDDLNEVIEPPVPHGLLEAPSWCSGLLEFYGLDPLLLVAASEDVDGAPATMSLDQVVNDWIESVNNDRAKRLLRNLLISDTDSVKASLLAEIRDSAETAAWPTTNRDRTLQSLFEQSDRLRSKENDKQVRKAKAKAKREAAKAERQRQERMKQMVKNPKKWLREAENLAEARGTDNYEAAADVLADLREALGHDGEDITRNHAAHLVKRYPTLTRLKSSLRKRDLLD